MIVYSICEETGLLICELFPFLLVREDGMVQNIFGYHKKYNGWSFGSANNKRYQKILIPKTLKTMSIHRLVALSFINNDLNYPNVDHIDGNKHNNRAENLRWTTQRGNCQNMEIHRNGRLQGATFNKGKNKWESQITINGKNKHLGSFKAELQAHLKYKEYLEKIS